MRHYILMMLMLVCASAAAQSPDKLYEEGKKLYDAKNYATAFPKLKAAAQKGHKKAQYRLGRCYDKGNGVKEDDKQAFTWYMKSAQQGFAKAEFQVGKSYKNGEGTEKNRAKAVEWFAKAAKQGNADGEYALAKCYFKGKGVKADKERAKKLLKQAVGDEKDGDEILADLRKDAAAGDADAKAMLALIGKK